MKKSDSIRQALKEMGYNSRQVSVKDRPGGYSWAFTLTIRDAKVNYNDIEKIKHRFVSVDRCERSGEILSGGNTFVDIRITEQVENVWASQFVEQIKQAIEKLTGDNNGQKINERFIAFNSHRPHVVKIWDENRRNWMPYDYSLNDLTAMGVDMYIQTLNK